MSDIEELEGRLARALDRIRAGLEAAPTPVAGGADPAALEAAGARIAELEGQLDAEQANAATAQAKLDAMMLKSDTAAGALEARIAGLTAELDRLESENRELRNSLNEQQGVAAALRAEAAGGVTEPDLINRSLLADVQAMQAARSAEIRDLEAILRDLDPILKEVQSA